MHNIIKIYTPLTLLLVAGSSDQADDIAMELSRLNPPGMLTTCDHVAQAAQIYGLQPCDVVLIAADFQAAQLALTDIFSLANSRGLFVHGEHIAHNSPNLNWTTDIENSVPGNRWTPKLNATLAVKLRSILEFRQLWRGYTETSRLQVSMLDCVRDGVLVLDSADVVLQANREAGCILGMNADALIGHNAAKIFSSGKLRSPELVFALPPMPIPGTVDLKLVLFRSGITSHFPCNAQALLQDVLTGLPTYLLMQDRLATAVNIATRYSRNVGLLRMELDTQLFAQINATYGYSAGDTILQEVAARLEIAVRTVDTVSRSDGGCFVALLQELSQPEDALVVARRIQRACQLPFTLKNCNVPITIPFHIGLANFPEHGKTAQELIARADVALTRARARPDNVCDRIAVYNADLAIIGDRQLLEQQLLAVLDNDELVLYYQPKINMQSNQLIGVEALIRWNCKGTIRGPEHIIPIAEELNLMGRLTNWVLREAVRQASVWRTHGWNIPIAVNVPPSEFAESLLVLASAVLREFGLPPALLELEVTESAMGAENPDAPRVMQELSKMGIRLSLDDFGTGYSSLDRLKTLPLQTLKIDRAFVRSLENAHVAKGEIICSLDAKTDVAIMRAIVALAQSLHMETVAEGIEGPEQLAVLRVLGVDNWQGFHASRALPAAELTAWLTAWNEKLAK